MQEIIIKKLIANDIKPEQVATNINTMNKISSKIVNVLNDMELVKGSLTDYGTGYYAMMSDIPKGKEYASKLK